MNQETQPEIICDWTVTEHRTYRFALSELVKAFPAEYAEAKQNSLSDREFVEECIDMGGVDAGMPIVSTDAEYDWRWK